LPWEVAVACGLLLMAISVERRIRTAWTNALLGQNLPGEIREISDLIPRGLLPILNAAVIIVGFLLILVGAPPVILLSLVLLVFLAAVEVTFRG